MRISGTDKLDLMDTAKASLEFWKLEVSQKKVPTHKQLVIHAAPISLGLGGSSRSIFICCCYPSDSSIKASR